MYVLNSRMEIEREGERKRPKPPRISNNTQTVLIKGPRKISDLKISDLKNGVLMMCYKSQEMCRNRRTCLPNPHDM